MMRFAKIEEEEYLYIVRRLLDEKRGINRKEVIENADRPDAGSNKRNLVRG
jgi:hypothetical protein